MPEVLANQLVAAALGASLTNVATTLTLATDPGATWPTSGTVRLLVHLPDGTNAELVTATGRSGTSVTGLARGQEGTTGVAHASGEVVELVLTAGALEARLADLAPTTLAVPSQSGVPTPTAVGRVSYRTGGTRGLHVDTGSVVFQAFGRLLNVREFGAKADYVKRTDAAITTGTAVLTSAGASFAATDVGKVVVVAGAGAAGAKLVTTIAGYTSATQVTLTAGAGTTVSGATFFYGTDDTAAFQAALDAASQATVFVPSGAYLLSTIAIAANRRLQGAGFSAVYLIPYTDADCVRVNTTSMNAVDRINNVQVADLAIYPLLDMTAGAALHLGNVGSLAVRNVKAGSGLGGKVFEGVRIDAVADSVFEQVWIAGVVQDGIVYDPPIDGASYVGRTVETFWDDGCKVNACGRYGVYVRMAQTYGVGTGTNSGTLEGVHFMGVSTFNNVSGSVRIETTTSAALIRNVHLDGTILDTSTAGPGLYVGGAAGTIENLVLDNLWVSANGGSAADGVYLGAVAQDVALNGGTIQLNDRDGVRVDGAKRVRLSGVGLWNNSRAADDTNYAVYLTGDAQDVWLDGVTAYNSGKGGYPRQNGLHVGAAVRGLSLDPNCVFDVGAQGGTIRAIDVAAGSPLRLDVDARRFGARGDARSVTDAVMAAGSTTLTSASANFTQADVGKPIVVLWAGALVGSAVAPLSTTIASVTNATTAVLSAAATTGVNGATGPGIAHWATDDTQALTNLVAGLPNGSVVRLSAGEYYLGSTLAITKEISLIGAARGETHLVGSWSSATADTIAVNASSSSKIYSMVFQGFMILYRTVHTAGAALLLGNVGNVVVRDVNVAEAYLGRAFVGIKCTRVSQTSFDAIHVAGCRSDGVQLMNDAGFTNVDLWFADSCQIDRNQGHGVNVFNGFSSAGSSTEGLHFGACSIYGNGTPLASNASGVRVSTASGAVVRNLHFDGTVFDTNYAFGFFVEGAGQCKAVRLTSCWFSYNGNKFNGLIGSYAVGAGGSGYTSVPTVAVTGGSGQHADAVATVVGGVVTRVDVVDYGNNYASTPTVAITGGGGTGATATAASPTLPSSHNIYFGGTITEFEVVGCTILLAGQYGVYVDGANRGRIQNCQIYDNSQNASAGSYGVLLNTGSSYVTVTNNRIYNTNGSYTAAKQNGLWINDGGTGGTPTTPTDVEVFGNFLDTNAGNAGGTTPLKAVFPMTRVRFVGNVTDVTAENGQQVIGGSLGLFTTSPTYGLHQVGGGHRLQSLASPAAPTVVINAGTGTTYFWFVVAEDHSGGRTLASTGTSASTSATPNATVKWTTVVGAKTYYVLRHTAGTLPAGSNATLVGTVTAPTSGTAPEFWFTDTNAAPAAFTTPTRNDTADATVDGNVAVAGNLSVTGSISSSNSDEVPRMVNPISWMGAANLTTATVFVSNASYFLYVGRIGKALTTIDVVARVATAAATITWAEVGVFKGTPVANGAATGLTRLGFTNVAATFNSTGIKKTTVALTGHNASDDLWIAFGSQATTPYQLRAGLADDLQSGGFQSIAATRISTMGASAGALESATLAVPWCQCVFV